MKQQPARLVVSETLANPENVVYIALSYCWGDANTMTCTTEEKFQQRLNMVFIESLPKTVREAVEVARAFKVDYLWVDAIYIKQVAEGKNEDWERELPIMGRVYSRSLFTIAASGANSSATGLFHGSEAARWPVQDYIWQDENRSGDLDSFTTFKATLPNWNLAVERSALSNRGWVMQERMLASRTLFWTEDGLFWECGYLRASEFESEIPRADQNYPTLVELVNTMSIDGATSRSQREGWLSQLYGQEQTDGTRVLQPDTVQSRQLDILNGLISFRVSPADAASKTASLVLSHADVETIWLNITGLVISAAETIDEEQVSAALIDFLVELASLPDAINPGPEAMTANNEDHEPARIQPGQPVCFMGGRLWRDLPQHSWGVGETFQGPEQYLKFHGGRSEPMGAMQKWKNFNTHLALMAVHPKAQTIPVLANMTRLGFFTLSMALEESPGSRIGRNSELHAPAAAQWLHIVGDEIEMLCEKGTERMRAGDLWKDRDDADVCNSARLAFWKSRLAEMGY
ncbi:hypothetical protein E8E12_009875 [Didymella heteroderae]|uniref:Heterokaryon incompatibility domain-containing protein n=1 Tax=Didymella heteroderae TaxID=1769908 RepID=A0A9P4WVI2_9PLEO|nr:hypothetical protein E8E12_009875 [Didymella heteroderae]